MIGTTAENLKAAAEGENEEWAEMYPKFADIAEEEGFKEIATMYRMIAKAEAIHEEQYLKLLNHVENDTVFAREEEIEWQCRNCGFVIKSKKKLRRHALPVCIPPRLTSSPKTTGTTKKNYSTYYNAEGVSQCDSTLFYLYSPPSEHYLIFNS